MNLLFVKRINTWTYISSFQISTFQLRTLLRGETPDYTEVNLVVKHSRNFFQLSLLVLSRLPQRQICILYIGPLLVKPTRRCLKLSFQIAHGSLMQASSRPNITRTSGLHILL